MTFELLLSLKQMAGALGGLLEKGYNLVGPVAPFLFLIGLIEGTLLLFLLSLPLWASRQRRRSEKDFLIHLGKGNDTLSNVAIVTGFVGTYAGLMDMLPVLATIVERSATDGTTGELLSGLGSAFVSSMVGLGLGGIVGSANGYLLDVITPEGEISRHEVQENDASAEMPPGEKSNQKPPFEKKDSSTESSSEMSPRQAAVNEVPATSPGNSRLVEAVEKTLASPLHQGSESPITSQDWTHALTQRARRE